MTVETLVGHHRQVDGTVDHCQGPVDVGRVPAVDASCKYYLRSNGHSLLTSSHDNILMRVFVNLVYIRKTKSLTKSGTYRATRFPLSRLYKQALW